MKKTLTWTLLANMCLMAAIIATTIVMRSRQQHCTAVAEPTEETAHFVTLTDAVPDAILEIRYYGTYNFVGTRIDGYLEPTALLTR